MSVAFECTDLAAGYGQSKVVRSFSLAAEEGTVVALLGPNGAGKTTLLRTIAGLLPRQGGTVSVAGSTIPSGAPTKASRAGIVLVPDNRALFGSLTVAANLKVAAGKNGIPPRDMLEVFPALESRWNLAAGPLSGGEQQMLAVARGLVQRPKVLLIDEMSMGLAPVIVESLLPTVSKVATDTGVVIVLVEQHVRLALEVAHHAMVLVHGEVATQAPARELLDDMSKIEAAYLGEAVASSDGH